MTVFWTIYIIGAIVAGIYGTIEAYIEHRKGNDISQYPAMICPVIMFSWLYVIIRQYFYWKNR